MTCISLTHDVSPSHGINIYRDNLMPLFLFIFYLFFIYGQAWSFTLGFDNSKCHLSRLQSIDEENLVTKQKEDQSFGSL